MKVTGSIAMYCGMKDPERELTVQESQKINELLCRASLISHDSRITYKMPRGYRVTWLSDVGPSVSAYVAFNTIALSCCSTVTYLQDTVGLSSYLRDLLAPTLLAHLEEGKKAMAKYNEEMLSIPK